MEKKSNNNNKSMKNSPSKLKSKSISDSEEQKQKEEIQKTKEEKKKLREQKKKEAELKREERKRKREEREKEKQKKREERQKKKDQSESKNFNIPCEIINEKIALPEPPKQIFSNPLIQSVQTIVENKDSYLPISRTGRFKFKNSNDLFELDLFETYTEQEKFIGFVGGSIWSMDWSPNCEYLALSSHRSVGATHIIGKKYSYLNIIQLWQFRFIQTEEDDLDIQNSKFSLGIAHNHGTLYDMKWCPHSELSNNGSSDIYSRLGLLAVATSDGFLLIYSVPDPVQLYSSYPLEQEENFLLINLQPVFSSDLQSEFILSTLSWRVYDQVYLLFGGSFGGTLAIWNFQDYTLESGEIDPNKCYRERPFIELSVYLSPISSISFSILNSYLYVVTSLDGYVKEYDIRKPYQEIAVSQGSIPHLEGTCASIPVLTPKKEIVLVGQNNGIKFYGFTDFRSRRVFEGTPITGRIMSICSSPNSDRFIYSDNFGTVFCIALEGKALTEKGYLTSAPRILSLSVLKNPNPSKTLNPELDAMELEANDKNWILEIDLSQVIIEGFRSNQYHVLQNKKASLLSKSENNEITSNHQMDETSKSGSENTSSAINISSTNIFATNISSTNSNLKNETEFFADELQGVTRVLWFLHSKPTNWVVFACASGFLICTKINSSTATLNNSSRKRKASNISEK